MEEREGVGGDLGVGRARGGGGAVPSRTCALALCPRLSAARGLL